MTTNLDEIFSWLQEPAIKQLLVAFRHSPALRNESHEALDDVTRSFLHRLVDVVNLGSSPYVLKTKQKSVAKKQLRQLAAEFQYKVLLAYPVFTGEDSDGRVVSAKTIASLMDTTPFKAESRSSSNVGLFSLKSPLIVEMLESIAANKAETLQRLRDLFDKVLSINPGNVPISAEEVSTQEKLLPKRQATEDLKKSDSNIPLADEATILTPSQSYVAKSLFETADEFNSLYESNSFFPFIKLWKPFFIGTVTGASLVMVSRSFGEQKPRADYNFM